jgi:hypothetical protein
MRVGREAFSYDGRPFSYADVLASAVLAGDWDGFARDVDRFARARREHNLGHWAVAEEALEAEVVAFRRARRLEAASDLRLWLADRELDAQDLVAFARCSLVTGPPVAPDAGASDDHDVQHAWWPWAVMSGAMSRWVARLVQWWGAATAGDGGLGGAGVEDPVRQIDRTRPSGPGFVFEAVSDEALLELLGAQAAFTDWVDRTVDEPALRRCLDRHRLDWTLIEFDEALFPSESAAREALMCVRDDGESMESVARRASTSLNSQRSRRESVPRALMAVLGAMETGGISGPILIGDSWGLLRLTSSTPPGLADPELRERARRSIIDETLSIVTAGQVKELGSW